jgi:hypothetical protein
MNNRLLEDIKRFKLMVNYDSNVTLSENYSKITLTEKKDRIQYCYRTQDGEQTPIGIFEDGNFQPTEFGKQMNILTYEDLSELFRSKYDDGTDKVTQCDGLVPMDNTKVEISKKDDSNVLTRRDIRRNKRAEARELKQKLEATDWLGKDSGTLYLKTSRYPNAQNVGENMSYVFVATSEKFDVKKPKLNTPKPTKPLDTPPTLDPFEINSDYKVFPDNIVNVNFDKFPASKDQFETIVNSFVKYIKAGGADKLTNVTIQGQADSANPSWSAPKGFDVIDHNYGGVRRPNKKNPQTKEELETMNLYLAKSRAHNYAVSLTDEIEKQTGVKITIKELTPISYLGQGESKRGAKYRSLILNPNAPKLDVVTPGDIISGEKEKEIFNRQKQYEAKYNPVDIFVGVGGTSKPVYQTEESLGPVALSVELPNSNFTNVTKGVYLRTDIIDKLRIPEEFGNFVSNATVNGRTLSITDELGKINTFEMINFDNSAEFDNVVSLMNTNTQFMEEFIGVSSRRGGEECDLEKYKYGTKDPLTTYTSEVITYNEKSYVRLKNYWFAVIPKNCSNRPPKIDYYKEPTLDIDAADEEIQNDMGY